MGNFGRPGLVSDLILEAQAWLGLEKIGLNPIFYLKQEKGELKFISFLKLWRNFRFESAKFKNEMKFSICFCCRFL